MILYELIQNIKVGICCPYESIRKNGTFLVSFEHFYFHYQTTKKIKVKDKAKRYLQKRERENFVTLPGFMEVQKDYIILQVNQNWSMFLEKLIETENDGKMIEDFLQSNIKILIERCSQRNQNFRPFIFAQLDSQLGFKIDLSFTHNQVRLRGILQHLNGAHVKIQDIYHHLLLQKLQEETKVKFMINQDTVALAFQSDAKLDSNSVESLKIITEHIKSVAAEFSSIYSCLSVFGIGKRNSQKYFSFLKKRLELLKSVCTILLQSQEKQQNNSTDMTQNCSEGKAFRYFTQIEQMNKSQTKSESGDSLVDGISNENHIIKGGYFQVEKQKCIITEKFFNSGKSNRVVIDLAIKTLRYQPQKLPFCHGKIERQLKTVNKIRNTKHILEYWLQAPPSQQKWKAFEFGNNTQKIYIEYIEEGLDDDIYEGEKNIQKSIAYSQQIIEAVIALHAAGIVHRDLKPDNLLLKKQSSGKKIIKVIDFSESAFSDDSFDKSQKHYLGSTIPYSPIECHVVCEQGFNAKQIDIWSVGVIVMQLFIGKNPLSYSRCFGMDIYKGWRIPEQFCVFGNYRKKVGIRICEFVVLLLSMHSIVIEQKKRISLKKMSLIVCCLKGFLVQMGMK